MSKGKFLSCVRVSRVEQNEQDWYKLLKREPTVRNIICKIKGINTKFGIM